MLIYLYTICPKYNSSRSLCPGLGFLGFSITADSTVCNLRSEVTSYYIAAVFQGLACVLLVLDFFETAEVAY